MQRLSFLIMLISFMLSCHSQKGETQPNLNTLLDSLILAEMAAANIPSVAVGVVKDDKTIIAKGYGFANVEDKIAADQNTVYQLGSVTKMFTGHLLATLIHQKELSLDDRVSTYFPDLLQFPKSPTGQRVKIKDLATHSAEFPRYPDNLQRIDPDPINGYSREEMYHGIESVNIDTVIGVRYNYSNFGYGVLGTALENKMGKSLSELFAAYIFEKYDMNSSSLKLEEKFQSKLAVPYLEVAPLTRTEPWNMETLSAAGNVFSSVADMNRFMIGMLADNKVNHIQQTKYLRINDTWSYGLGCFIVDSKKRNTPIIYHGGDIDGYASSLSLYPEHNMGVTILINWGEGQAIGSVITQIYAAVENYYLGPKSDE